MMDGAGKYDPIQLAGKQSDCYDLRGRVQETS